MAEHDVYLAELHKTTHEKFLAACDKAKELGATEIEPIIKWAYARGFPSPSEGKAFAQWCDENGVENNGYHAADPKSGNRLQHVDSVGFRWNHVPRDRDGFSRIF